MLMSNSHPEHPNLRVVEHPLISVKLGRLRDKRTSSDDFRRLLDQVAGLMVYSVSEGLETSSVEIETPLEVTQGKILSKPVTLVPILRAGIGMTDGILALMPEARVGHIGVYRDEERHTPVAYYEKFPGDISAGPVLIVDPMLATGGSATYVASRLRKAGCKQIGMVCLVAAPEGVAVMAAEHPEVTIFTASLDRELSDRAYILPGLGDAGDRIFGTQ